MSEYTNVTLSAVQIMELRAFWPSTSPIRVLADRWDCSEAHISQQAKRLGLPSRQERKYQIRSASNAADDISSGYLMSEASKRGLTDGKLVQELMRVIVKDRLVTAILDDEPKAA